MKSKRAEAKDLSKLDWNKLESKDIFKFDQVKPDKPKLVEPITQKRKVIAIILGVAMLAILVLTLGNVYPF